MKKNYYEELYRYIDKKKKLLIINMKRKSISVCCIKNK